MTDFDFSVATGGPAEVIAIDDDSRVAQETWRLIGSEGDEVLADAYLATDPRLVVIAGHGRENSRRAQYVRGTGMLWAPRGISVMAMDAPLHGDRAGERPVPEITAADPDLMVRWVRDQRLLVDAVEHRFGAVLPIAYMGFSMGGVFGAHLVASEPRLAAFVCVVAGSTVVSVPERAEVDAEMERQLALIDPVVSAPAVAPRPVLMVNADDDEVFSLASAMALYGAFDHPKEITFFPGRHSVWRSPHQWYRRIEGFLSDALISEP